ncbi:MAG: hypothetical protein AMS18_05995 [Gemmatimonas sp. SG8_17]|nr:MAG: hypothetical protein AMS18_05995 [Gemmatimonas sp. SG8_17]
MRGGEKVLEVCCELYPDARIHTLLHLEGTVSRTIESHPVSTSFVQHLPFTRRSYRHYLPLFPLAAETLDVGHVDLVLSSSHCVAKNVRVPAGACHIAYIHTPMRYVWDQYDAYFGPGRASLAVRAAMRMVRPWLQRVDVRTSRRVHYFIANSRHVAHRIRKHYNRDATVIYPPVDVDRFQHCARDDGYYLMVTAFAPYKRVDIAVKAFNQLGKALKIVGSGQDGPRLEKLAGPNIEFLGWQSDQKVHEAYRGCRALIFPGEEDFGIVPVEAMAVGKPVIAFGRGGALETIVPLDSQGGKPPTGVFFHEQTSEALSQAVGRFEQHRARFESELIRKHAESFGRNRFADRLHDFVRDKYAEFCRGTGDPT